MVDISDYNIKYVTEKEKYEICQCVYFYPAHSYGGIRFINGECGRCDLNGIRFVQKAGIKNCKDCEKILGIKRRIL